MAPAEAGEEVRRALVLVAVLALTGCLNATAKKVIFAANDVQDGAKGAYDEAKTVTEAAGKQCGAVARAATPPVVPSLEACAALGVPIPYDPAKLNTLAGPVNAAYEAIRGAEAARLAWQAGTAPKANVITQVTLGLEALSRFVAAANDVGLKLDTTKLGEIVAKWDGVK